MTDCGAPTPIYGPSQGAERDDPEQGSREQGGQPPRAEPSLSALSALPPLDDGDYNVWGGWGTSTAVSPITVAGALPEAPCIGSTSTTAPSSADGSVPNVSSPRSRNRQSSTGRDRRPPLEAPAPSEGPGAERSRSRPRSSMPLFNLTPKARLPRPPAEAPPRHLIEKALETTHVPKSSGRKPPVKASVVKEGLDDARGAYVNDSPSSATPEALPVPDSTCAGAVTVSKARPPLPAGAVRTETGAIYFASPLEAQKWLQQRRQ